MDYYRACARLTCRHFDISAQTIYRWLQRYRPGDLTTLESRSRRPRRLRQPSWSAAPEQAVLKLRWGKDKLAVELTRFRRRCWGERKKEVPNAKNPSTIRAGVSAPNHRVGAHGAPDCAVGP
jgi:transposase-like protein